MTPEVRRDIESWRTVPLPRPGQGRTSERFRRLAELAARDMRLARLVEADADARAIADDLRLDLVDPGAVYGVWAAGPSQPLQLAGSNGSVDVTGTRRWCGGARVVDRALLVVSPPCPSEIIDVAIRHASVVIESDSDDSPFGVASPEVVSFSSVPAEALAAPSGAYIARPGFWHGAVGVAAIWCGGLRGVYQAYAAGWQRSDAHAVAELGAARAELELCEALLRDAARTIDAAPGDVAAAENLARWVRRCIERAATRCLDHLGQGAGPGPLVASGGLRRQTEQLQIALRQQHAMRDLEPLGRAVLGPHRS